MTKEQIDRLQALADLKTGDAHFDAMKAAACKAAAHRELTVKGPCDESPPLFSQGGIGGTLPR